MDHFMRRRMEEKLGMRTEKEIKVLRGIRVCTQYASCNTCPYRDEKNCNYGLMRDARDVIHDLRDTMIKYNVEIGG